MKVAIKSLFSKVEKFLIRNNKRFVIKSDSSDSETSSDLIVQDHMSEKINEFQDQRLSYLLEQTGNFKAPDDEPP